MRVPSELISGTIWLALALVSLVAWFVLRRRRRASDHPHCQKCDFDLFGLPETSHHCPECGTDIRAADTRPSSVAVLSKWRSVVLAAALLMTAMSGARFIQYLTTQDNYWHHPAIFHALRYATGERGRVLDELARRTPDRIGSVSAWVIGLTTRVPSEPLGIYSEEFASVMLARSLNYVGDAEWTALVESSVVATGRAMYWQPYTERQLLVRADLSQSDQSTPVPDRRIIFEGGWLTATVVSATLDGVPLGPPTSQAMWGSATYSKEALGRLQPTERSRLMLRVQMYVQPPGATSAGHTWEVVVPATIEVQGR